MPYKTWAFKLTYPGALSLKTIHTLGAKLFAHYLPWAIRSSGDRDRPMIAAQTTVQGAQNARLVWHGSAGRAKILVGGRRQGGSLHKAVLLPKNFSYVRQLCALFGAKSPAALQQRGRNLAPVCSPKRTLFSEVAGMLYVTLCSYIGLYGGFPKLGVPFWGSP